MTISLIVAHDLNGAIGKDGDLPWHLPNDLKWFKRNTLNKIIVMGRTTYEGLKIKPLPRRMNVVMTRQANYQGQNIIVCQSVNEVLTVAMAKQTQELMIIGGGEIYQLFYPLADKLYVTQVHTKIENADTHFVNYQQTDWYLDFEENHKIDEKHDFRYDFLIYKRKLVSE